MPGHSFALEQDGGGKVEGRAIDTIGYRGMHSFEVSYADWFVPAENLVGEDAGSGPRLLPPDGGLRERAPADRGARRRPHASGVRRRARVRAASASCSVEPVFDYQLSQAKLARMAASIQAGRQFSYDVAARMGRGEGTLAASMVKAYVCRAAEWVTREAMQLHGGMGYAEEFPVSRYFVDARVLSIFEGADETLCLRVIAPATGGASAGELVAWRRGLTSGRRRVTPRRRPWLPHSVFDAGDAEVGVDLDGHLAAIRLRHVRLVGGAFGVVLDPVDGGAGYRGLGGRRHLGGGVTGEQRLGDAVRGVATLARVRCRRRCCPTPSTNWMTSRSGRWPFRRLRRRWHRQ